MTLEFNRTKCNFTLIDPLFEVTGRRKLNSVENSKIVIFRQKHRNSHFLGVLSDKMNFWPLLTPYLKLQVEGNLIGQWGLESRNPRSKTHEDGLFPGFNRLNGNLPLFDPLFDIFRLQENCQPHEDSKIVILGKNYLGLRGVHVGPRCSCGHTVTLLDRALDIVKMLIVKYLVTACREKPCWIASRSY